MSLSPVAANQRLERAAILLVAEVSAGHVEAKLARLPLLGRVDEAEPRARIDEPANQPRRCDAVDLDAAARRPGSSDQIRTAGSPLGPCLEGGQPLDEQGIGPGVQEAGLADVGVASAGDGLLADPSERLAASGPRRQRIDRRFQGDGAGLIEEPPDPGAKVEGPRRQVVDEQDPVEGLSGGRGHASL